MALFFTLHHLPFENIMNNKYQIVSFLPALSLYPDIPSNPVVVSNARERRKGLAEYNRAMEKFLALAGQVLKKGRFLVLLFNARGSLSWEYLRASLQGSADGRLEYRGHFPLSYSAGSVVQDSRKGSLKHDFVLVFQKPGAGPADADRVHKLEHIEGWSSALPEKRR